MKNDWILDVLSDLKNFAQSNGHMLLADQLAQARLVATVEIASADAGEPIAVYGDEAPVGANPRRYRTRLQS